MSSSIDIYNQALLLVGADPIVSFADETTEANVGKVMYDPIKAQLLRSYPWRCATKTATLAKLADAPVDPEWLFAFAWPDDAVRMIDIFPLSHSSSLSMQWMVERQTILTKDDNVGARYIFDIPEPELDAHVEMALVAQLAMDISYAFTAQPGREAALASMFANKISEARTTDRQEASHKKFQIDGLSAVRL